MISIQKVQTDDRNINQLQNYLIQALRPITQNPETQGTILTEIQLATGSNTIQHGLGVPLQGWQIIRQRASASIYDTQDTNPTPQSTLLLTSSAPVSVDLYVF